MIETVLMVFGVLFAALIATEFLLPKKGFRK